MRPVTLAATQMSCSWDVDENIAKAEAMVRRAAEAGAQVILLQELFETPYFCITQDYDHLDLAQSMEDSRVVSHFGALAGELGVVLPVSFYERSNQARFNSLAILTLTVATSSLIAKAIYRSFQAMRKSSTSRLAILVSRWWKPALVSWAVASAGINGSPRPPARWPSRVQKS